MTENMKFFVRLARIIVAKSKTSMKCFEKVCWQQVTEKSFHSNENQMYFHRFFSFLSMMFSFQKCMKIKSKFSH